ncbi:MAG: type I polyketide synthase [Phycisphaera sp.]|nr:type I polyketide synthase [Phycisphaera sp.]
MNPTQRIAIVGIGGVFPGSDTPDALWRHVVAARDLATEPPAGRWALPVDEAYSPTLAPDKVNSRRMCFVDGVTLDHSGLDIDADLVRQLDPMFHLVLHAGRAAWLDAVTDALDRSRVGVIIGNIALPTDTSSALADELLGPAFESRLLGKIQSGATHPQSAIRNPKSTHPLNRYVTGLPGGVLAKALRLGGGSWTLDAACASSLYALKFACDELLAGRADAMLAGGLSRPDALYTQMGFSQLRAVSPTGRCSPFDRKADGLVVGEGSGIVVLKRLDDALRDGDHVYATIAGIGLSNDIEGNLMQPASEGQVRAMRDAYAAAGWSPSDVDLIECHGTGTPTGDAVEFNSLATVWGDARRGTRCVIGSVKSNVGHLLTAAGSAGLIKTLLALKHGVLPPTANYEASPDKIDMSDSPFEVLAAPRAWPRRADDRPRRAAVSAFGFGGINAHVLLEELPENLGFRISDFKFDSRAEASSLSEADDNPKSEIQNPKSHRIAVVGLDARVGPWDSLASLRARLLGGAESFDARTPRNWWGVDALAPGAADVRGHAIDHVDIPLKRFRIPPTELRDMLPQQALMLLAAAGALDDAGLGEHVEARLDTGVFIGIGLDLNTTNFHFRWTLAERARMWNTQLGLGLSDTELDAWAAQLRDAAGPPLTADRTMGNLGGIVASRVARAFRVGGPSFTISSEETSGVRALEAAVGALQRGEVDKAIVGAVDFATDPRAALNTPGLSPDHTLADGAVAFILKRHEDAVRDGDKVYALISEVGARNAERGTQSRVVDHDWSATPCVGDCGAASAMVSVLRAVLGLHHHVLPPADSTGSPRYWLRDRIDGPRRTTVHADSVDGNHVIVALEGVDANPAKLDTQPLGELPAALFVTTPDQLDTLRQLADRTDGVSIEQLARLWKSNPKSVIRNPKSPRVALVVDSVAQLRDAITDAQRAVSANERRTGDRVWYSPQPLCAGDASGEVAFVFPGSGSHFVGMGREAALAWPDVVARLDAENDRLASQFADTRFWSTDHVDAEDHPAVIFGQVWAGTLISDVIARFDVRPDAVIGYSLGETAGMFATRSWARGSRDLMYERICASKLFTRDLAGPCESVRTAWGLREGESVDWQLGVVDRSADVVRAAIAGREHVYLLIVNTPGECVVGGQRDRVQQLVRDLGCAFHAVEGVTTVHCDVARPVFEPYRDLHLFETKPAAGVRFYSGVLGRAYEVTRDSIADSIVGQAVQPFDYTKVIESAYADGVRVFVEMGPGATCSRMISQILGDRPHAARSACVRNERGTVSVLRTLAMLIAEGVAVDLGKLYGDDDGGAARDVGPVVAVIAGGEAFDPPAPRGGDRGQETGDSRSISEPARPRARATSVSSRPVSAAPRSGGLGAHSGEMALQPVIDGLAAAQVAHARAEAAFVALNNDITATITRTLQWQMQVIASGDEAVCGSAVDELVAPVAKPQAACVLDYAQCLEFAIGSIAKVLGPEFAEADTYPSRVRLPDEPLQLVHRITAIDGEPRSMTHGRVVTEHDIVDGAWYLDGGRIPTCIAVEAGQADLFLSGYLGIDFETKGHAVYRLLDAIVTFHRPLPGPGETIVYDIRILHFFRQGDTYLFRFEFDATVNGESLLTMRDGCAGFFTQGELDAGKGIVLTTMDKQVVPGPRPEDRINLAPLPPQGATESYSDAQVDALRRGDLVGCFGDAFAGLPLRDPVKIPSGLMTLVHRIVELDPYGGRFGRGIIVGEADIHPDDWFLTCHFFDDNVMPGTLMYECCLHTLRILLTRLGWVGEVDEVVYEPIPGVPSQLKCRGQVIETTKKVTYELTVRSMAYEDDGTPVVLADALMYGDGRPIVQMKTMSVRLSGLTRQRVEQIWRERGVVGDFPSPSPSPGGRGERSIATSDCGIPFDSDSILAFAVGKPSEAFGDRYKVFDAERVIARLPGPPYKFLDRITRIESCEQWVLKSGGKITAEYDVPRDAWYFAADEQTPSPCKGEGWGEGEMRGRGERFPSGRAAPPPHSHPSHGLSPQGERGLRMPYAVLLEVSLQPCGWLAAYLGSALTSDEDLSFRNLGGSGVQHRAVTPDIGTLYTDVTITGVSQSGGMIIQHFAFDTYCDAGPVYTGKTYFGFFAKEALANQVGIRDADVYEPSDAERARAVGPIAYPTDAPYPDAMMRMVDRVEMWVPDGGPHGLGFIRGTADVDPSDWFYKAHFYQDPVWPGSLGLESMAQLMKYAAVQRWGGNAFESLALGEKHEWMYRGQILPTDRRVTVQAVVTEVDDARRLLRADGHLSVDGRIIYQMSDFAIRLSGL